MRLSLDMGLGSVVTNGLFVPNVWILLTGFWVDLARWDDSAEWID